MLLQDHTISGPWSFLVKEEVQCLCEGGKNCSHENPARQQAPNAIAGLHSSWVGDQVLAMARPWQENVLKHDVVAQFKQHNIGMILNLQEVSSRLPPCGSSCLCNRLACCPAVLGASSSTSLHAGGFWDSLDNSSSSHSCPQRLPLCMAIGPPAMLR